MPNLISVAHQETSQRFHALHEGNATEGDRRMYAEGVGCDQSDSWPQGQLFAWFQLFLPFVTIYLILSSSIFMLLNK